MAEFFIEVPIETDADALADNAIDVLQAQWTDWEPNEGDPEVIQIEALSQMAADVATWPRSCRTPRSKPSWSGCST
jgi:hypothetical protein